MWVKDMLLEVRVAPDRVDRRLSLYSLDIFGKSCTFPLKKVNHGGGSWGRTWEKGIRTEVAAMARPGVKGIGGGLTFL